MARPRKTTDQVIDENRERKHDKKPEPNASVWESENQFSLAARELERIDEQQVIDALAMNFMIGLVANQTLYNGHADSDDWVVKTANRLARVFRAEQLRAVNASTKR